MFFDLHLARIIFTFAHTTRRDARTRRQYKKFFVRTAISPPFSRKTTPHCELSSASAPPFRRPTRRRATLPPASLLAQTSQNQSPPKRAFCHLCAEEYYFLGFLMLAPPPRKVRGGGQPCLPLHSSLKPHKTKARRSGLFVFCVSCKNYLRGFLMLACAAASLAMGTRKGEQDT